MTDRKPVYWECTENGSNKFWAAHIVKSKTRPVYILIRRWGKIDTEGQQMEQEYENLGDAEQELEKLIWHKEKKGYKSVF